MDKAIVGDMRVGYFRIGVFTDTLDVALEQLKKAHPPTFSDAVKILKRIT
jgi:hypothetical protein